MAMEFNPNNYGTVLAGLIADRDRRLDAGEPNSAVRRELDALTPARALGDRKIVDADMAASCLSAVWLVNDFLDESHRISQRVKTCTGSFWHGIMHRREGDYANSKYWFGNVGHHHVYPVLAATVGELAGSFASDASSATSAAQEVAEQLAPGGQWNAAAFVDLCQWVVRGHGNQYEQLARAIQQREWELLFDDCYRQAVGE